jgi:hypothetical protein
MLTNRNTCGKCEHEQKRGKEKVVPPGNPTGRFSAAPEMTIVMVPSAARRKSLRAEALHYFPPTPAKVYATGV